MGCCADNEVLDQPFVPIVITNLLTRGITIKDFKQIKHIKSIEKDYEIKNKLGKGAYGTVYAAVDKRTNVKTAIKFMEKKNLKKDAKVLELLKNELLVLVETDHPHIV